MTLTPLVAMKSKMGEFQSLLNLVERGDTTPRILMELLDTVQPEGRGQLMPALVKCAAQMAVRHRPLWIDTHLLTPGATIARYPGGALEHLDNRIETTLHDEFGLLAPDVPAFVPVIAATATDDELRAVALLQEHREREVVIRICDVHVTPGQLDDRLRRIVREARTKDNPVHAVIDLGHMETIQPHQVSSVLALAAMLTNRLGPASTTLLAGSIPGERTGYVTAIRKRPEVLLWRQVTREAEGAEIAYGDYGVVHPRPLKPGTPGPRTINPYLYYTVPNSSIAMRRQLPRKDGKVAPGAAGESFAELADELVSRPEFAGSAYSWGDRELAGCRRGGGRSASTVSRWVAIAMSHHLEHLAQRAPSEL